MSWYDGVPASSLYLGPPQDYPAAAAASSAAQFLMTGASGGFSQPSIPAGFFPLDKQGRAVFGVLSGKLTGQASATTAIWSIGVATASNTLTAGTGGATLVTLPAITITSFSNAGWEVDFKILMRGAGYGGTTVATSLLTTATATINNGTTPGVTTQAAPNLVTTIDASIVLWITASVTFSTANATNSCTLQSALIYGMA